MKVSWNYYNPTKFHFGDEKLLSAGDLAESLTKERRVGIVTGRNAAKKNGFTEEVLHSLKNKQCYVFDQIEPEPSNDTAMRGKEFVEKHEIRLIVAVGGGSAIDAAKAISCLAYTDLHIRPLMDREVAITEKKVPVIAIPTTAGSGSELTPFSVLTNTETQQKKSLPSPYFYPDVAIVLPRFITTCPQKVIGDVGMDALAHSFEALWSIHNNPISDAIAFKAIRLIKENFLSYYSDSQNIAAAAAMSQAASLAGKSFSNTFTAACHGLSYPIGHRFHMSHGASCAMTLHLVARFNEEIVREKFQELAIYLGLNGAENVPEFISQVRSRITTIPTFRELNASLDDLNFIARGAFKPLLNNNPVLMSEEHIVSLLASEL